MFKPSVYIFFGCSFSTLSITTFSEALLLEPTFTSITFPVVLDNTPITHLGLVLLFTKVRNSSISYSSLLTNVRCGLADAPLSMIHRCTVVLLIFRIYAMLLVPILRFINLWKVLLVFALHASYMYSAC